MWRAACISVRANCRCEAGSFARWVADIQHIKPGARMPGFDHLDQASLAALAAFLDGLK